MILKWNQIFNYWRARAGLPYWSLSQYLKLKVKNAVSYISSFEDALASEARKRGLDGVICGHIHKPEIREIGGILYCNDGDWVESLSALVEEPDGVLRLVTWGEVMAHTTGAADVAGLADERMEDQMDEQMDARRDDPAEHAVTIEAAPDFPRRVPQEAMHHG